MSGTATEIRFGVDGCTRWAGMGDFRLVSPDGVHAAEIFYLGETPHGDSCHRVHIDGRSFPGEAWGCLFAFSPCSRYLAFSWMARHFERRTVVVDLCRTRFCALPIYLYDFRFDGATVIGADDGAGVAGRVHRLDRAMRWRRY